MLTDAKRKANAKYSTKARKEGKICTFGVQTTPQIKDNISDFCTIANISKAEFLRKLSAKIDDGTLYTFLNIDVEAAKQAELDE